MSLLKQENTEAKEVVSAEAGKEKKAKVSKVKKMREAALTVQEALKAKNVVLEGKAAEALVFLTAEPKKGGFGEHKDSLVDLFGEGYKVGAKCTAFEAFDRTGKGFSDMRKLIKKQAEKGITIEYDLGTKTYEIKAIAPVSK